MPVKKVITKTKAKTTTSKLAKPVVRRSIVQKINPKFEPYHKLLLKMKDQLVGDIRHLSDDNSGSANDRGGDVSGHALHMADVATDMYDREFNLSLAANERELLNNISEALGRILEGSYGNCIQCKKPIPATRLKAIPHALTCLKCQEALESGRR